MFVDAYVFERIIFYTLVQKGWGAMGGRGEGAISQRVLGVLGGGEVMRSDL